MACDRGRVDEGGIGPNMESLRAATEVIIEAGGHETRRRGGGPIRLRNPDDMGGGTSTERPNHRAIVIFQNEGLKSRTRQHRKRRVARDPVVDDRTGGSSSQRRSLGWMAGGACLLLLAFCTTPRGRGLDVPCAAPHQRRLYWPHQLPPAPAPSKSLCAAPDQRRLHWPQQLPPAPAPSSQGVGMATRGKEGGGSRARGAKGEGSRSRAAAAESGEGSRAFAAGRRGWWRWGGRGWEGGGRGGGRAEPISSLDQSVFFFFF